MFILAVLAFAAPSLAQAVESVTTPILNDDSESDITVRARSLKLHDEVSYTPQSVSIEQPASDVYLGETLSKLPGMLVRSTSGFGSVTTVISAQALGSAGTAVSIDDIPVIDSTGRGVNFSLFPSTLIASVEHRTAFYPSLAAATSPAADVLPAAGGRIDLKTLQGASGTRAPFVGSVVLGTAHTIEGTAGVRGGDDRRDWVAGVTGYNTAGDYHYVDPTTGASMNRMNNDAVAEGGLAKMRWRLPNDGEFEALDLVSNDDRTNPGSLLSPARQHQKDEFNLVGAKFSSPKLFSPKDGFFAKAAYGYARTATRGPDGAVGDSGSSTDQRANGTYAQAGYSRRDGRYSLTAAVDNQYTDVHQDEGTFTRELFGGTVTGSVAFDTLAGEMRVVPLGRVDTAQAFPASMDGQVSVVDAPDSDDDVSISYGSTHTYPALTSVGGFTAGGLTVLSNPSLLVQRDSVVSLTVDRHKAKYTLYSTLFYDLVTDRSTFNLLGPTTAQFVNLPQVAMVAWTVDGQYFPVATVALRASGTVQRAWDRSTGHEMPFKPRLEGWTAVSDLVLPWLGVTVQEQFTGSRLVSVSGVDRTSPFAQTIVRVDAELGPGVAYFKVANVFDASGFDYPGYPYAGRSFWLGYTVGGAAKAL